MTDLRYLNPALPLICELYRWANMCEEVRDRYAEDPTAQPECVYFKNNTTGDVLLYYCPWSKKEIKLWHDNIRPAGRI